MLQLSLASHCSPEEQSISTEMQSSGLMNCDGCRRCRFGITCLHRFSESSEPTANHCIAAAKVAVHCAIGYEVISVPVLICIFVKGGNHPRLQSDEISICILTRILGNTKQLVE